MKILLTMNLPYLPAHGGANKANRYLCEGLAAKGHSVMAVGPARGVPSRVTHAELLEELAAMGLSVRSDGGTEVFHARGVEVHAVAEPSQIRARLLRQIEEFKPDWVLVSSEDPSQNLLDAALKACPGRVIFLAHSMSFLPFGPWSFFPSRARAAMLGRVAAVVAVGDFVADYIKRWGGLDASVIHWPAYGGGPFPLLGSFDNSFVTMVNPCAVKGIDVFLALARSMPDVAFAAVPTWGTTDEDRAALGGCPNVTLLPPADDIDDILKRSRAFLVPSLWGEGFPLTVVESMLRGIPVLASDSGGTPEAKLGAGGVVPVRSVEGFTERLDGNMVPTPVIPEQEIGPWRDALRALLSDRDLYARQARAEREAATRFVSGLGVAPFEALFERLEEVARSGRASAQAGPRGEATPPTPNASGPKGLADMSPEQRALLLMRLRKKGARGQGGAAAATPNIRPVSRETSPPLSFAQQRLWFVDQMEPDSQTYNIAGALRLEGDLNVAALGQALSEIVRRHEILRTTFGSVEGRPVLSVAQESRVGLPVTDLQGLPAAEAEAEVIRLANEEALRPFRLDRGPLMRAGLLRLGGREHVLLLAMHHIVSDGWSLGVLIRELAALYKAFAGGSPSPLPELPIQYADFAHWQRQWLSGDVFEKQLAYWKRHLAGAPSFMELPADRPRPPVQTFNGRLHHFTLPARLGEDVRELARREGATLFMVLLAAFQLLLQRHTGSDRVVVGTNIAGRNRADVEPLIGLFANNLVLHADLSGDPTFAELIGRAREAALGAYEHQDFPFEKLVEALRPERDASRQPLMQVLFVLQNAPPLELELDGLRLSLLEAECRVSKFDLTLFMEEGEGGLRGSVEYNTDLFNEGSVARLLEHFTALLEDIAADPRRPISEFSVAAPREAALVGAGFNDDLEAF